MEPEICLGGLVVTMLAIGPKDDEFKDYKSL
jgi:hypothetical protein